MRKISKDLAFSLILFVTSVVFFLLWYSNALVWHNIIKYTSPIYEFFGYVWLISLVAAVVFAIRTTPLYKKKREGLVKRVATPDEAKSIAKLHRTATIASSVSFFAAVLAIPCFIGALAGLCDSSYCPGRKFAGLSAILFYIFIATAIIAFIVATVALVNKYTISKELSVPAKFTKLNIMYTIVLVAIVLFVCVLLRTNPINDILVFILQILPKA